MSEEASPETTIDFVSAASAGYDFKKATIEHLMGMVEHGDAIVKKGGHKTYTIERKLGEFRGLAVAAAEELVRRGPGDGLTQEDIQQYSKQAAEWRKELSPNGSVASLPEPASE